MKTGKTLQELVTEIERQAKSKSDYLAQAEKLYVDHNDGRLGISQTVAPMALKQHAHRQLGEYVGIPAVYYDRLLSNPELFAANVNHWLAGKSGERRMVRALDGNVRALLSESYKRVDNIHVANVALEGLSKVPGIKVVSTEVTESRLYIKAVSTDVVAKVNGSPRVGDLVEAGVLITNSEVGLGAINVKRFMNFLACLNGLVLDKGGYRAAHIGRRHDPELDGILSEETLRLEGATVLSKVADVLHAYFDPEKHRAFVQEISNTTQEKIVGDVPAAVRVLGDELNLLQGERNSVLDHLIRGGDLSRFGLVQAVTRTAEDVESYDRATELEEAGGRILTLPKSAWKRVSEAEPLLKAA